MSALAPPRWSITRASLARPRFVILGAILICLLGLAALLHFPATEEPPVTLRVATVEAYLPGETAERMEADVARPIEEALRAQSEVKTLDTRIRPGAVLTYVTLQDTVKAADVPQVWQRLRVRLADARATLPAATSEPRLNDDFGRVAVKTYAVTGKGYSAADLERWARHLRNQLQDVPGLAAISLHGARQTIAYVDLDMAAVRQVGTDVATIARTIGAASQPLPTGEARMGGVTLAIQQDARIEDITQLARLPVALPNGQSVALGTLGKIRQTAADPSEGGAFFNGQPAVVLGISMQNGVNVVDFAKALDQKLDRVGATLPAGLVVATVTDQASVVAKDLRKVGQVFIETVAVVLGVVMLFLGRRAGLVTGAIVPMTVLGTLLAMQVLHIPLHQVSIAAIIIALGIFVDNGIVVVEDYQRRVAEGETPIAAAYAAGESMLAPLLVSSLAIIFAFAPLVAGETETAEYMRSLGVVFAITLLLSLVLALSVVPLLSLRHIGSAGHDSENEDDTIGKLKRFYKRLIVRILAAPGKVALAMTGLLAMALVAMQMVPAELFPPSQRKQVQMPIELAPGTSLDQTMATAGRISMALEDRRLFPQVTSQVVYVGDGGPRFILGLNPPAPAAHRAYAVINLAPDADVDAAIDTIATRLPPKVPGVRLEPKRFFLGSSEAGMAVFRLLGPDRAVLDKAAAALQTRLTALPGIATVRTTQEAPLLRLAIAIDDARLAAAGLNRAAVTDALNAQQSGITASVLRQQGDTVPVIVRAGADERVDITRLAALPVGPAGSGLTLGAVATIRHDSQTAFLARRDSTPVVELTARGPGLTAQEIVDQAKVTPQSLGMPEGYAIKLGGEIEESGKANDGLMRFVPLALAAMGMLFLWQFGSVRKAAIVLASMPFVIIGATLGLLVSGQPMSFSATIGILALMGIIVNNAILLLGRIAEERAAGLGLAEAIAAAGAIRLRPIVMTKLVCIAGLVPLFAFGGALWRPMAAAMTGGLALGTMITLVLIPSLYALAFRKGDDLPATYETAAAVAGTPA